MESQVAEPVEEPPAGARAVLKHPKRHRTGAGYGLLPAANRTSRAVLILGRERLGLGTRKLVSAKFSWALAPTFQGLRGICTVGDSQARV